jgi:hypothetical protein
MNANTSIDCIKNTNPGAAEVAGVATAKGSGGGWYTMTFAGKK